MLVPPAASNLPTHSAAFFRLSSEASVHPSAYVSADVENCTMANRSFFSNLSRQNFRAFLAWSNLDPRIDPEVSSTSTRSRATRSSALISLFGARSITNMPACSGSGRYVISDRPKSFSPTV